VPVEARKGKTQGYQSTGAGHKGAGGECSPTKDMAVEGARVPGHHVFAWRHCGAFGGWHTWPRAPGEFPLISMCASRLHSCCYNFWAGLQVAASGICWEQTHAGTRTVRHLMPLPGCAAAVRQRPPGAGPAALLRLGVCAAGRVLRRPGRAVCPAGQRSLEQRSGSRQRSLAVPMGRAQHCCSGGPCARAGRGRPAAPGQQRHVRSRSDGPTCANPPSLLAFCNPCS
jgi:hypothetical protein